MVFHFKKNKTSIHNYGDENTTSYSNQKPRYYKRFTVVYESITCVDIFRDNKMQANFDKFQAIVLGMSKFENCKRRYLKWHRYQT